MAKNRVAPQNPKKDNFFVKSKSQTNRTQFKKQPTVKTKVETLKDKAPFDKKQWRIKKYSKKYKLQQWEEKHKKTVLKEYYKQVKDEPTAKLDVQKIYDDEEEGSSVVKEDAKIVTRKEFLKNKNQLEFDRIKQDKAARKEEIERKKSEKEEAMKVYKQKKAEKNKKLNRKTKRGQPIMKERLEMLLEEIQKSV